MMAYSDTKQQPTRVVIHFLKATTQMFPHWKSLFCCAGNISFRRIWNSLIKSQTQANYTQDFFYSNNSPIGPFIVYG